MKFTLTIDCDNAAFAPVNDDASEAERYRAAVEEVRDILRDLLARGGTDGPSMARLRSGFLRDSNGNRCGQWNLRGDEETDGDVAARIVRQAQETGYRRGRRDYAAIRDEANNPATAPVEVPMELLNEMLEVVPPIYVRGGFLCGECITGDARGDVYAPFAERHGKAFARYAVKGRPETYIR